MCGRFGLKTTFSTLARLLRAEPVDDVEWGPDFNIAPTDPAPVLLSEGGVPRLRLFRWGLVPFWADDPRVGVRMINARGDTIATKPAFRESFEKRRLLVPAHGWYEWVHAPPALSKTEKPQPFWLHQGEHLLMFAGVWSRWRDRQGQPLDTFAIATTDASPGTRAVHDRMPVVLDPEAQALWLDPETPRAELEALLVPYAGPIDVHAVAKTVNNVRADGPELILPIAGADRP